MTRWAGSSRIRREQNCLDVQAERCRALFPLYFWCGGTYNDDSPLLLMSTNHTQSPRGIYRFAVATSCFTILLLMAGALVTSNDAADSVPDWPLAYGRLIPPWVGGIRYEYTHRVLAAIVSVLTLTLAIWLARSERRPLARRLGWTALVLVLAQAALGGFRVLVGYPALSSTAHATLAQIYFITVVGLALYLSPWWQRDLPQLDDSGAPPLRTLAMLTTAVILMQLILGAAFRHGAFGLDPHLMGAGLVTVFVVWTGVTAKRRFRAARELRRSTILLHSFFGIQILLGLAAWWAVVAARDAVQPTFVYVSLTVAHVLGGALTLAASVILTLTSIRLIRPAVAATARSQAARGNESSPERAGV
jgi:heme a synthase